MKHVRTYLDARKRLGIAAAVLLALVAGAVIMASMAVAVSADWRIDYVATPGGHIEGTASQSVLDGERSTTVTATPDDHYHFVMWTPGGSTETTRNDLATGDATYTANFAIDTHTLKYVAGDNGSIVGSSTQVLDWNTRGTEVTATPATGYHFDKWSDDLATAARQDTATADATFTASFSINTYTLKYHAGVNGSLTGSSTQVVDYNSSGTTVTATPASEYHFVKWSDDVMTAARRETSVTAGVEATATFAINTYTITVAPSVNGTVTPGAVQTIDSGSDSTTLTIAPNPGYHFEAATDNGSPVTVVDGPISGTKQYKFKNVTGNHVFSATFARTSNWVPVYRFFQLKKGSHFYTSDEAEKTNTINNLSKYYRFEGVAYQLDTTAPTMVAPLYRFYNTKTGVHFYTASSEERDDVMAKFPTLFRYEGVAYNVSKTPTDAPVYRFFNRKAGTHFYTSDESEKTNTINNLSSTFTYEGVGYYLAK